MADLNAGARREAAIALRLDPDPRAAELWAELAAKHDGQDRWYLEVLGIGATGQWEKLLRRLAEEGRRELERGRQPRT